jgi:hypothetical protein
VVNLAFFNTHILNLKKKIVMLAFFEIFEAKRAKNGSKNKKKYLVNVF